MFYSSAMDLRKSALQDPDSILSVVQTFYDRIDAQNPRLNAYVELFKEQALQRAKQLSSVSNPEELSLYGVPVSIKESFAYKGSRLTVNFPPLKNYAPENTSVLAQRLEDAGAIILGKTNVPLLLSDCQTFGPLYPTANNPFDLTRTPGGSTGGGAAALAAGLSTLEIGSDIGGSIRNPANFCGLFGLKPTVNGHVHDGHVPPLPNRGNGFTALNSTGPLARSMDDIERAFTTCYAPLPEYQQYPNVVTGAPNHQDLSDYKIAWYDEVVGLKPSSPVQKGMQRVLDSLRDRGAQVEQIKIDQQFAQKIYSTWLTLFGFVVGQDFPWFARQLLKVKFSRDLRNSTIADKHGMSKGLSMNFKRYSEALSAQKECIAEFYRYFEGYDFILSPTSMGPAFEHNHKHQKIEVSGETYSYSDYCFLFVTMHNLTGFPVLTIPSGIDDSTSLPIGISVIAQHHNDRQLIHFGGLLESAGFKFVQPEA